jgi:putative SOS response-associated peptidase YedK
MAEIHNRMPVILDDKDWPKWLGEDAAATNEELLALLRPCPDKWLKIWAVAKVGNVRNTGAELALPL